MSISNLANATELDVNVKSLTTQQDLVVRGSLRVKGNLDVSGDVVDATTATLTADTLHLEGGPSYPSGFRPGITYEDGALLLEGNNAFYKPCAMALHPNNDIYFWAGPFAGTQRETAWNKWPTMILSEDFTLNGPVKIGPDTLESEDYGLFSRVEVGNVVLTKSGRRSGSAQSFPGSAYTYIVVAQGQLYNANWIYFENRTRLTGNPDSYARLSTSKAYFATEQHPVRVPISYTDDFYGLILSSTGKYMNKPTITEAHVQAKICDRGSAKCAYGVYSPYDFPIMNGDEEQIYNPNIPQKTHQDKIGFASSGGEGMMWVCDENGSINNGDFLQVSSVPGIACRQTDDLLRSTTVFKSAVSTDFRTSASVEYPMLDVETRTISDDNGGTKDVSAFIFNEDGERQFSYLTDEVHTPYDLVIHGQYYEVSRGSVVKMKVPYDFQGKDPAMIGKRFKATLIGGMYKF